MYIIIMKWLVMHNTWVSEDQQKKNWKKMHTLTKLISLNETSMNMSSVKLFYSIVMGYFFKIVIMEYFLESTFFPSYEVFLGEAFTPMLLDKVVLLPWLLCLFVRLDLGILNRHSLQMVLKKLKYTLSYNSITDKLETPASWLPTTSEFSLDNQIIRLSSLLIRRRRVLVPNKVYVSKQVAHIHTYHMSVNSYQFCMVYSLDQPFQYHLCDTSFDNLMEKCHQWSSHMHLLIASTLAFINHWCY